MATKKEIAERFTVDASLMNVAVTRAGSSIKLKVLDRGKKLGELHIGRGSIFWWGAKKQRRKRLWWGRLAEELNRLAYGDPKS